MYIFSKLSLVAIVTVLIAFVAGTFNVLDMKYAIIVINAAAIIQLTLLILLIVSMIIRRREICGVKIKRYQFSDRFIKGNEYMLPEYFSTTNPRKSAIFKILLEIKDVNEPPEITVSRKGVTSVPQDIKDNVINVNYGMADDSFIFDADILVKPGEKINLQLKKDTLVKSFFLGEFYIP